MSTVPTPIAQRPANHMVQFWMTRSVLTINLDTNLSDALALMHEYKVRRLPVVDAAGKLCGIITEGDARGADVIRATGTHLPEIAATLRRTQVSALMTSQPLIVKSSSDLCEAACLMRDYKVGGLPVVDDKDMVIGIITESDLFNALITVLGCDTRAS